METAQFLTLAGLSVVSIGLCIYLLSKIRTITYLLEQPVVKKMSPQLKLKPVKVDELDESRANVPSRNNANGAPQNRGPRPGMEGGDRPPRENRDGNRDRAPRGDRPEGEGRRDGERMDRGPRNDRGDRGDRGDRFGGRDRDRGGRHDRHDRGDRFGGREGAPSREGGRDRNREGFGGEREPVAAPAPATAETVSAAPVTQVLAPRRPLPSTVDQDVAPAQAPVDALAANPPAEDALFTRDDSDIQHGRRHQPKKKPRFDLNEEEVKEETKAL